MLEALWDTLQVYIATKKIIIIVIIIIVIK